MHYALCTAETEDPMDATVMIVGGFIVIVALFAVLGWWWSRAPACPICGDRMLQHQLDARGFERHYCERCEQWIYDGVDE